MKVRCGLPENWCLRLSAHVRVSAERRARVRVECRRYAEAFGWNTNHWLAVKSAIREVAHGP
jgi:hypothetical protein